VKRTEEQQAAVTAMARRLCVDAGAGSGKTRVLVERILHLIEHEHARLDHIVAITFTEKAAGEMKARLRRAFREKAPRDDPKMMSHWRELERQVETARISTIHAFCAGILRENALRLGLDPDFTVLAEAELELLLDETVTQALHDLLDHRDPAALELSAEFGAGHLIDVLKRMLKARDAIETCATGWPLDDAEALRRHWKALVEADFDRRLSGMKGSPAVREMLETLEYFDDFCMNESDKREVLRQCQVKVLALAHSGAPKEEIISEAHSALTQTLRGTSKKNWDESTDLEGLKKTQEKVKAFISNHCLPPEFDPETAAAAAQQTTALWSVYRNVADAFEAARRRIDGLDFTDLILRTRDVLESSDTIRVRVARSIDHLLIDEFQDTDDVQLAIARALTGAPGGPHLFIVGDAKQSIYRFRGAQVEVFAEAREEADRGIQLNTNFRSLPDLLAFIDTFFRDSRQLHAVEPDFRGIGVHRPETGECRVEFLIPELQAGDTLAAEEGRRAEAELIAWRIRAMLDGESAVTVFDETAQAFRPARLDDMAILFRSTSDLYIYEEALRHAGIDYALIAGQGFYERQEIRDIVNLLKVVCDPWDETALLGFLRGPMAGLSDNTLARVTASAGLAAVFQREERDLMALFPPDDADLEDLKAAQAFIHELRGLATLPLTVFLRRVLDRTGFEAILLDQYLGLQKALNVRKLIELAADFAHQRPATLRAFVQYLDEAGGGVVREGEALLLPRGAGAVTLMTVHKAKGLEFPVVFLADMSRKPGGGAQFIPLRIHRKLGFVLCGKDNTGELRKPALAQSIQYREAEEDDAEQARILYVALTRARDHLVLCGAPNAKEGAAMHRMDKQFGLFQREDGDIIDGTGWRARIWRTARSAAPGVAARSSAPALDLENIARSIAAIPPAPSLQRTISVSALLNAWDGVPDEEDDRPDRDPAEYDARDDAGAANPMHRGILIHRLFETWDFQRDVLPTARELIAGARLGFRAQARLDAEATINAIADRFRQGDLFQRLTNESNLQREAPFYLKIGETLLSGTIDLILEDGTIIDYKTGRPHPARNQRYSRQLRLYAAAVQSLLNKEPPKAILAYVDHGIVEEVTATQSDIQSTLDEAREVLARMRTK
jgi:ATP-dependent helicase/nuclease subunit A